MYTYVIRHEATIATAITAIQLKASASGPFEILGATATQRGSTTSAQEAIALVRKTVAATVTIAVAGTHVFKAKTNDPTAGLQLGTAATGVIGTAEGTDGDIACKLGFNVLSGYVYLPVPEARIWVPAAGLIALKFLNAPATQTWDLEMIIREYLG